LKQVSNWIGVDRNATGHVAVAANPASGKVWKLCKSAKHVHEKYRCSRRRLQRAGKYKKAKSIRNRESRIVRDINHKISRKLVDLAEQSNSDIKLEKLAGIRKSRKHGRRFKGTLHSWSFYQLQNFLEYKARLRGIPIAYVEPRNTSKECSRCGNIGTRQGKKFTCQCGHVDHADANAGFNISMRPSIGRFNTDRDVLKGNTDTLKVQLFESKRH
jgi:putative transposase